MKEAIKIFLIALPFAWLAPYSINFLNQFGFGIWLVETLSIRGFWPVSIAFYIEDLISALITLIPYIGLIYFFIPNKKPLTVTLTVVAYMLFTFLFLFQKESFTASFFTMLQSANIAAYLAIIGTFALMDKIFRKNKSL